METLLDLIGAGLLVLGTAFLFVGGLGLNRMPDVLNRIQVGTKASTLGTLLTLAGAGFLHPDWALKLLLVGLFLLFTNPLSAQVLARAAHRGGHVKLSEDGIDHLAEDTKSQGDKS